MGLFSRLFGSNQKEQSSKDIQPEEYKGFLIYQEAQAEGGQFRIAGRITKNIEGEVREHRFIRSDVLASESDANEFMLAKAKMFIDQTKGDIFT
ncbi:HlyU family transcriptional regulator [Vibrio aquimaris]|uniref:Transcriptional activator HlyU n=1 Tax=Vibrio aquimaris TaxID=2587862 RepID=A0A5P9CNG9_9VIBR|nr:HlyU family transcriptional regulator [Vibrio aquimaris]QFT27795.1 Transcriptional activator HlyU [Vibrio aquimaris]